MCVRAENPLCMRVCACVRACMHACMCVCAENPLCVCMCVCVHENMHACMYFIMLQMNSYVYDCIAMSLIKKKSSNSLCVPYFCILSAKLLLGLSCCNDSITSLFIVVTISYIK